MPFDPFWLILAIPGVLSAAWQGYEHHRVSELRRATAISIQSARNKSAEDVANTHDYVRLFVGSEVARLDSRLNQVRADTLGIGERLEAHQHPHDHESATYHVHWARFNSTEITNGLQRDVYTCLVPGCKAILAHTPEA